MVIRYFLIVAMMVFFVLFYVWQNIEVMKIHMDFRNLARQEKKLLNTRDTLLSEIESLRSPGRIEDRAEKNGFKSLRKSDVIILKDDGKQ